MHILRPALPSDIQTCIQIRGLTRENAVSATRLAELGITETLWAAQVHSGEYIGFVHEVSSRMTGYVFGSTHTGEIIVLAVLPEYENQGIAKALMLKLMQTLNERGFTRLFLGCAADPQVRSYGFYRHLGWLSTGQRDGYGDEVLEYFFSEKK